MAIAGGAVIPYAFAALKQHYDFQLVYMALCVPSYLYIFYYGARGHQLGQSRRL
jgi:fucose permease